MVYKMLKECYLEKKKILQILKMTLLVAKKVFSTIMILHVGPV